MSPEQYQQVQEIKRRVMPATLTDEQRSAMNVSALQGDAQRRIRIEIAAIRAVEEDQSCRRIPTACVLCALGKITCPEVDAIIASEDEVNQYA